MDTNTIEYSDMLATRLAQSCGAMHRCDAPDANECQGEWFDRHKSRILAAVKEYMPSGSGIDSGTEIDLDKSNDDKLVFTTQYHHMDENGSYDGWTEHTVKCEPTFGGLTVDIGGRNRNDIKDYLGDVYHQALSEMISDSEWNKFCLEIDAKA